MPRGGARKGAGRLAGGHNTKTKLLAEEALKQGISPLEAALQIVRDLKAPIEMRMRMIEATLAYCHPKIAAAPPPPEPERPRGNTTVNIISIPNGRYLSREEADNFMRPLELLPAAAVEVEPAIEVESAIDVEPAPEHYSILE